MAINQKEIDNQTKVTHRVRIMVPVAVEVEVWEVQSPATALSKALEAIAERMQVTPMADRYSWRNEGMIDAFSFAGDIKHLQLPLKPIPQPVEKEVEEEA